MQLDDDNAMPEELHNGYRHMIY
ncbi:MAG: hypothetical protein ACSLEN_15105 [Candidatus Malihini olakiniferum]